MNNSNKTFGCQDARYFKQQNDIVIKKYFVLGFTQGIDKQHEINKIIPVLLFF